jgi:hypothetical protein
MMATQRHRTTSSCVRDAAGMTQHQSIAQVRVMISVESDGNRNDIIAALSFLVLYCMPASASEYSLGQDFLSDIIAMTSSR